MKHISIMFKLLVFVLVLGMAVGCAPAAPAPVETQAPPAAATEVPAAAPTTAPVAEAKPVALNFVVWSYGIETITDNIKNFEAMYPNIKVTLKDYSWLDYHDTMVAAFAAGNAPELLYGSDHWLQEWASAGWLQPIDELCPNVKGYSPELAPYALEGMTYDGKIYGLSYYADTMDFVYNETLLKNAGIEKAPETWDDVYTMSKTLKEGGLAYPIIMAWSQKEGAFPEAWTSMVFSQQEGPNALFDKDLKPVFNQEGSAAFEVMEWLRKVYAEELFDPASLITAEIDQVKSMQAGQHAFTIFPQYNMAEVNKPESGEFAGQFKIALMPGKSHATVGYVRFYAMTPKVVEEGPEFVDAACKFLDYFGGKTDGSYTIVKRWGVENGLGFAQLPLFQDADVIAAFGKWGDVPTIEANAKLARAKEGLTTWYGAWDTFARAEIHKAILGEETSLEALNNMAAKWEELKAQ
ncbi:MAG: extracellular solute-binding protein [Anaerolineales bacterium]|nr:extracellular solute-binding protein [Anaerolineales bacterium]